VQLSSKTLGGEISAVTATAWYWITYIAAIVTPLAFAQAVRWRWYILVPAAIIAFASWSFLSDSLLAQPPDSAAVKLYYPEATPAIQAPYWALKAATLALAIGAAGSLAELRYGKRRAAKDSEASPQDAA